AIYNAPPWGRESWHKRLRKCVDGLLLKNLLKRVLVRPERRKVQVNQLMHERALHVVRLNETWRVVLFYEDVDDRLALGENPMALTRDIASVHLVLPREPGPHRPIGKS